MKQLVICLATILLIASCNQTKSKYAKAIAKEVQTDHRGTKYDLNFKVVELEELQKITVGDSLRILTDAFNTNRNRSIASYELDVERNIKSLENAKSNRFSTQTMIKFYEDNIAKYNRRIDSLKAITPTTTKKYEARSDNEILAILVRCKYAIDHPLSKVRIEENYKFTLSPDGTKCYSMVRVK